MKLLIGLFLALKLTIPFFEHTEADTRLLADVMWLENGSTGITEEDNIQCLILTGAVPVNRAKAGGWGGSTLHDVIYARGQYAYDTIRRIRKCDTPQYVIDLAEEILTYGTNVPNYVVYQSMQSNLGIVWKTIKNKPKSEYFATEKGHKDEGQDIKIITYKKEYYRQAFQKIINKLKKASERLKYKP